MSVSRRAAAPHLWTCHVHEVRYVFERRTARPRNLDGEREQNGESILWNRHDPARLAVDHRYRRSPVALPRYAPIFDTERHRRLAEAAIARALGHAAPRLRARQAGPRPGVFQYPVFGESLFQTRLGGQRPIRRSNHRTNRNSVLPAKLEVALVVSGHGHNRARAVAHHHEIRDPHRHPLGAEWIQRVPSGEETIFFDIARVAPRPRVHHGFGARSSGFVQQLRGQRMLRSQNHARRSIDGIGARREHANRPLALLQPKIDLRALGPPDPVALHGEHAFGPAAFELRHIRQQPIRVRRNLEKPLLERALLDGRFLVAPAAALDHLLVRQHRGALGTPVDQRLLPVGQPALQHLEKKPLVPAVVLGLAGGDFAVPVVTEGEAAVGLLHRRDVLERPLARRPLVGDGGVLGGQPEGVPSHGVQHVIPAHPLVARQRIADGVVANVPDVQGAARIGQHLQYVELRLSGILLGFVEIGVFPTRVPFQFDLAMVVRLLGHKGFRLLS